MSQSWTIGGVTVGTLGQRDALRAATPQELEDILTLLRAGESTLDAIEIVMGEITEPYVEPDPPPAPLLPAVKMYRYATREYRDHTVPPFGLNYVTGIEGRLHPTNSIIVDGEIRRTDYYASALPPNAQGVVTYSDLVLREDFVYTRDGIGFARARVQTITWYTEDDQPHPDTKQRLKFYENDESLREGQRRRRNITDTLSMNVTGWLVQTQTQHPGMQARIQMGRDFMSHHKLDFDMYADASDANVLYAVRDDVTHPWLDSLMAPGLTVRAYILDALNIWNIAL